MQLFNRIRRCTHAVSIRYCASFGRDQKQLVLSGGGLLHRIAKRWELSRLFALRSAQAGAVMGLEVGNRNQTICLRWIET